MSKIIEVLRKALSVTLMVTVGSFYSLVAGTVFAQSTPKLAGFLSARGTVSLNGISAGSGATVFSGNQIKTGANGSAIVSLGKLGQVDLGADSELTLNLEAGLVGGYLRMGRATIIAPVGIVVNVTTMDGVAVADGRQASVLTVDITNGNTKVVSARSEAKVRFGDKVETVAAGQEISVGTGQVGAACECLYRDGTKSKGTLNDKGVCVCKDRQPGGGMIMGSLSPTALFALIVLGVGGAVGGIIAATQGDETSNNNTGTLSNFR